MSMQTEVSAWRIGFSIDVSTYIVRSQGKAVGRSLIAEELSPFQPTENVVEVLHRISGMWPHALLAGTFEPSGGDRLRLEVVRGAPFDLSGPPTAGPLGLSITVGLPPELAEAAAEGFVTAPAADPLPAGIVKIVGGGIDHDSSPTAFLRCGALLRVAMVASASSSDPLVATERLVEKWWWHGAGPWPAEHSSGTGKSTARTAPREFVGGEVELVEPYE